MENKKLETIKCPHCNEEMNARAIKCKHCDNFLSGKKKYEGLDGWLIFVGIGLILGIIFSLFWLYMIISLPSLTIEVLLYILLIIFNIILLVLYFQKRKSFPKAYIIFQVLGFVFIFTTGDPVEIAKSFIAGFIWIFYMLKSKRVKQTFVK